MVSRISPRLYRTTSCLRHADTYTTSNTRIVNPSISYQITDGELVRIVVMAAIINQKNRSLVCRCYRKPFFICRECQLQLNLKYHSILVLGFIWKPVFSRTFVCHFGKSMSFKHLYVNTISREGIHFVYYVVNIYFLISVPFYRPSMMVYTYPCFHG